MNNPLRFFIIPVCICFMFGCKSDPHKKSLALIDKTSEELSSYFVPSTRHDFGEKGDAYRLTKTLGLFDDSLSIEKWQAGYFKDGIYVGCTVYILRFYDGTLTALPFTAHDDEAYWQYGVLYKEKDASKPKTFQHYYYVAQEIFDEKLGDRKLKFAQVFAELMLAMEGSDIIRNECDLDDMWHHATSSKYGQTPDSVCEQKKIRTTEKIREAMYPKEYLRLAAYGNRGIVIQNPLVGEDLSKGTGLVVYRTECFYTPIEM